MDKSQLRRLALDFADGQIPAHEYHVQRRKLIDGIVDGSAPIQRESRPAAIPKTPESSPPVAPTVAKTRLSRPQLLGAASAACAAIVAALLLWPADDPPPAVPVPSLPAAELSPARTLVESFVARRNFAFDAVADFEKRWIDLAPGVRDEARGSLWFSSLVRALRDEIKTQNALSGLSGGETARERARRVAALGERLGIAEQLPDLDEASTETAEGSAPGTTKQAPGPTARVESAQAVAMPAASAETPATNSPSLASDEALTGREWLARRSDTDLTLQLFAVNGLDRVEHLMATHPELAVRILATDGATPRYRVFHGVFADETAARNAFDALPGDLTGASGGAIVKSFAAVRDDLAVRSTAALTSPATRPTADAESRGYTLQLFASGNRSNAEALLKAFPALPLQLRVLNGDVAPFRVVYGRFDNEDSARAASRALPATLLTEIGKPLAKPVADTGRSISP